MEKTMKKDIDRHTHESKLPHHHHSVEEEQILIHNMPGDGAIGAVAEAMKQLGDPTRLKIFWILCHTEECVLDIAALISMSSPAVAHHLKLLKTAGLVTTRREGKEVYYKAAETPLVWKLHTTIEDIADIRCPQ